jgi:hypothetical protein
LRLKMVSWDFASIPWFWSRLSPLRPIYSISITHFLHLQKIKLVAAPFWTYGQEGGDGATGRLQQLRANLTGTRGHRRVSVEATGGRWRRRRWHCDAGGGERRHGVESQIYFVDAATKYI